MDLQSLSLPDWLPWWAVLLILVPAALYLALFLLMPFQTFGLRARIVALEGRIDELHEEIRALTLRLPERGMDPYGDGRATPPIPPAAREAPRGGSLGDPVADRMLAYMRDKAQADLMRAEVPRAEAPRADTQRAEPPRPQPTARPRTEPSLGLRPPPRAAEPELPPPPPIAADPQEPPDPDGPPRPPRVPGRFGRLRPPGEDPGEPGGWQR
jgi:hypothetical protein